MFLRALVIILESIFFLGLAGSLVVALLAFVGDIHVFFDKDEVKEKSPAQPQIKAPAQGQPRRAESH